MTPRDLMILAALALIFVPLEHLRPTWRRPVDWNRIRVDVMHIFIGGALIRWGAVFMTLGLTAAAASLMPGSIAATIQAQPVWLQFIELFLLSDLAFYAAHRLFHAAPFLWRFHEIHHSSEHLDWIATHRVHPVDQILNATIIAAPALLLGFSPLPMLIYGLIYRFHAVLLHSNVRLDFGPLRWIIASPQHHHWHHADQPEAYDKNFGGQLVIFDWLFGTLNLPARAFPERYGVSAPVPSTYLGQLAHPFRPPAAEPSMTKELA